MSKRARLTVGSLRGVPQLGVAAAARPRGTIGGWLTPAPAGPGGGMPPSKRGRGCCRQLCAGCPYTEAVRRRMAGG